MSTVARRDSVCVQEAHSEGKSLAGKYPTFVLARDIHGLEIDKVLACGELDAIEQA